MTTVPPTPRRSLLRRFTFDAEGNLRGWRLLALAGAGAFLFSLGTVVSIVLAGTGTPAAIPGWVVIGFVAIKLPLLAILWWVLGRRRPQDADVMSASQAAMTLDRLRRAAGRAGLEDDAWDRLDGLAAEARFVTMHAPPDAAAEARALAEELEAKRDGMRPPARI